MAKETISEKGVRPGLRRELVVILAGLLHMFRTSQQYTTLPKACTQNGSTQSHNNGKGRFLGYVGARGPLKKSWQPLKALESVALGIAGQPPTPNQRKKENVHKLPCNHVPTSWSLL